MLGKVLLSLNNLQELSQLVLHPQEMLGASVAVRLDRISDGVNLYSGKSQSGGLEIESIEEGGMSLLQV